MDRPYKGEVEQTNTTTGTVMHPLDNKLNQINWFHCLKRECNKELVT